MFGTPIGDESRKRPFSSISSDGFPAASPTRMAVAGEHRPIVPYPPNFPPMNPNHPNHITSRLLDGIQFNADASDISLQQPEAGASEIAPAPAQEQLPEVEDTVFERYVDPLDDY